jgi:hypothetical protein
VHRTKCEVELGLDEFALEEVDRVAERLAVSRQRVVAQAVRHWLDEQSSGRLAARPPPAGRAAGPHPTIPLAVDLPLSDWNAVRHAAEASETEPERLIGHAVLLLLADLDSGHVVARVARLEDGGDRQ